MASVMAVLGFHKIGEPSGGAYPTWNYVSQTRFREQLSVLGEQGWSVIDLETFRKALVDPGRLAERSALITFDDGYRSTLTEALPCLDDFGLPAVVFVPTEFVGGLNDFDRDIEPEESMCSWDELRTLQRNGVCVQAHGVSHRALSNLTEEDVHAELAGSRRLLEAEVGRGVDVFAYPYGDDAHPSLTGERMRSLGYAAAFLYGGGPFRSEALLTDPYRLPRLAMGPDSDLEAMLSCI